ncbi:caprin-1 isoform X2 [Macaca nemestrina]|uniref:caprin-1 isoform X2 n=1 Tax=Macaca fascicularis TaxID=9541 RepID=UPI00075F7992|nr:caprin-1 isoform X2 [Macaca fascicularis]XP_024645379.1 caprin-1 isoform X1 [Macaca nemestrina]XP_028689360.1 caprin-1 isoform X2 [Macaca mulatta]
MAGTRGTWRERLTWRRLRGEGSALLELHCEHKAKAEGEGRDQAAARTGLLRPPSKKKNRATPTIFWIQYLVLVDHTTEGKLDDYQERMNKGERLNQDQLDAVSKYQEVTNNLEFAKELQRSFMALSQDIQKTIKKTARREQLMREEAEQKRLKTVLELQYVLDKLGDDEVRTDLKQGLNGVPILSEEELSLLDEFYKLVDPERDMSLRLNEQYEHASIHLWDLLEGKEKPVCGTTYKVLKEIVERVFQSNYFDSTHNHQNGLCEEEEAASAPAVEDQVPEAEPEPAEEYTEQSEVESTEYVNRQFMAETQFTSGEKEQVDEWTVETVEVVNSLQQQPQAASPSVPEPHSLTPVAQADPLVRRQRVQDLMAQMQGPYNFIQDSMLDFENQTLDPAIVSAQPMNPTQNMDMPQLVCPPVHSESRLAQPNQVPVQPEATQVPLVSSTSEGYTASQPLYQPSHATEQRPQKEPIDQIQATISLNTDQTTASSSLPAASQPQVFQAGTSKPLHSSGINVNAAPFQSMQTVFNMNAPVPPVNEPETLKQQNQYQASYNQSFSSQPHQVEQTELQQEQLQTVVGTYHGSPDQSHQVTGNHQQPPQQNTGFPRSNQPYYNSRGVSRGGSRGARGLMNGYRGPANGFRGGYDGYRPSFSNTPNSGYTQSQFSAPRDYSGYQRDGYQQNFKRGSGQSGPRGAPRGNILWW